MSHVHVTTRPVAALYVRRAGGVYAELGVDTWDKSRDARNYPGPNPVVAHPPCGPWGRFAWKSKEDPALAPLAVRQVRRWGGVVEHPADSRLWSYMDLPRPGASPDSHGGWTIEVEQSAWGHRAPKRTWLYVVGVPRSHLPPMPPRVPDPGGRIEFMCEAERERTPVAFARFLVQIAELVRP